jgi:4-alpha-glucanotransferase
MTRNTASDSDQFIRERGAGLLLHITSLPSKFGIGDLGPAAQKFADFLQKSGQKYWQMLPLNPTSDNTGHSPYSSISAMAGNTLLISPELLMEEGLLTRRDIDDNVLPATPRIQYRETEIIKEKLFKQAYRNFREVNSRSLNRQFEKFNQREAYWLNDFALYSALKNVHHGKAWHEWPSSFKNRNEKALQIFSLEHADEIEYIQWLQFIFHRQWKTLREYCDDRNIKLFGDLPFYVSHDSVDVWSDPENFSLNKSGAMVEVAGVPPDYFNEEGQRWGMPIFRWDILKKSRYSWWMERLRKNMEFYDILRLDHFRAFADYWSVPAKEPTAKKGRWKPGPGAAFFRNAQETFKALPFVAEDLGEINAAVYELRDQFQLPGMRVLQFAFGENMPYSEYIPHNYTANSVVYTGTHDNNTSRGWYRKDLDRASLKRLIDYSQRDVHEQNVHDILAQLAYGSVANTVILPMQDVLGLDESARMNTPASTKNNWQWRMSQEMLTDSVVKKLRKWVKTYRR